MCTLFTCDVAKEKSPSYRKVCAAEHLWRRGIFWALRQSRSVVNSTENSLTCDNKVSIKSHIFVCKAARITVLFSERLQAFRIKRSPKGASLAR